MPISTTVSPQTELSGLGSIQTLLKVFPTVTATLAENTFFRPEVPTASSGSHPLSLNTTHIHGSLPSHLLRCSTLCWQQHRRHSRQERHGAALRSLHLTPSHTGRTQEHGQTVGHHSSPSISQKVSFSSICVFLRTDTREGGCAWPCRHMSQELPLSTGWAQTAFMELSSAEPFCNPPIIFLTSCHSSSQSRTFQVTTGTPS